VFCGHKNFFIGKQPEVFPDTNTVSGCSVILLVVVAAAVAAANLLSFLFKFT